MSDICTNRLPNTRKFEENLGYFFQDTELLEEAFTHSSYANEQGLKRSNERLEYLGDAVLELCVSEILYRAFPDYTEGQLTRARASIVSEAPLAKWGASINAGVFLRLGKGTETQGGRDSQSIIADAIEAVLGAIFLDGGYKAAAEVIRRLVDFSKTDMGRENEKRDYKTRLQEVAQARWGSVPSYRVAKRAGPDHAASFVVELTLPDGSKIWGKGSSIKLASFEAAKEALKAIDADR
ncbi:ribonuclease 3 [Synergistales bacterium]|nr:ribonuclease 3 [Synergistales bacterium]